MIDIQAALQKTQHHLRVAESRFHSIVNNSLDGILIISNGGDILFSNPAAASLFGRLPEDLRGVPFGFPVIGADRAELDIPLPAGKTVVVEMRVAETEWDGNQAFVTQLRDITQRKQTEESLRLAAKVFENSSEAIIILDPNMHLLSGNKAFAEATGYSQQEVMTKDASSLWSDQNNTVSFQQIFRNALNQRGCWQGEVNCHGKDGRCFPGWLSAVVVRDSVGIITHYVAIFSDISERKANENALRLAAVVFEQSIEAVIVLDDRERFVSVNSSFTRVTGYTAEEVIGRTPRILKSGRQEHAFYAGMWQQIKEQGFWQGEVWNRRKSGEIYPEWLSISAVRNEHGEVVNYIGIFSDITERKKHEASIHRLAFFDPLTHLPNRALLNDRMKLALANAERNSQGIGVIFIDLNRFKEINDIHGHDVGDEVLVESARRFQASLRQGETLARLGGDEFVVIVDSDDLNILTIVAERLQQSLIEQPITLKGHSFSVGLSAGIALYPLDGLTGDELLKCADIAMYRAKNRGGGYCFYSNEMSDGLAERILLAQRLGLALTNNTLQLYYQPQVDLASGELVGAEALLRWHDEILGWISPTYFIPIAEERGMMLELGAWVLKTALAQLRLWREAGLNLPGRLAINISAQEIESAGYSERLHHALVEAPLLELELTEGSLVNNIAGTLETLHILRGHQFSLAIDDFGTGYSSLSYLTRFPIQKIKIDAGFVRNMLSDEHSQVIVQTIIAMAKSLEMQVIAEGVEDEGQAGMLLAMGCDQAQGYFYGHAEPADVFAARLRLV
ncbi:MAG: EAL domain-containing protein [Methylobacter sp.]|uniref:EAL domain-containing protein n=1 Tax=Methylobacter sp. TaxID=2051955 RepID=UPI0025D9B913|nr:EAL domain-containing protein [Methylobacter sp.]MCK9619561.1 EAL domain-containing protein [Methylobacter sp.]